ncbi:MAG: ribonuclease HII [Oscillospiraceae bacterium]
MDTTQLYVFDEGYRNKAPLLCGVDEAGRGPLCGPVAIGAVILDPQNPVEGLNDSKKLSEKKRKILYEQIVEKAVAWKVILMSAREIDGMNIRQAVLEGMRQAVAGLETTPNLVLVDGNDPPEFACPCMAVVKGDATSASIAAASIMAKVTRDRLMCELDKQYPEYMLAKHKGYPTKQHYEIIDKLGLQDFYRFTYLKKWSNR